MYHSLPLQPQVPGDLPAFLNDTRARSDEPAVLSYRSEAFAEDLSPTHSMPLAPIPIGKRDGRGTLLLVVPLGALLAGALAVFGLA